MNAGSPAAPASFSPCVCSRACSVVCFWNSFRKLSTKACFSSSAISNRIKDVQAFTRHLAPLKDAEWVVYAKPPFGGPQQVLEYLGRYTHRVAISNQRLLALENGHVSFQWKDYRTKDPSNSKVMTLEVDEFIRRFLLHVLPPGLQRIRYAASSPTATVRTTWLSAANC